MAIYSTGISVAFASSSATEVTDLSWQWGNGLPVGRGSNYTPNVGTVTVGCFGAVSTASYGVRGSLTISGGGMNLTCTAVCTGVSATAELNGVTRYTVTFQILDN